MLKFPKRSNETTVVTRRRTVRKSIEKTFERFASRNESVRDDDKNGSSRSNGDESEETRRRDSFETPYSTFILTGSDGSSMLFSLFWRGLTEVSWRLSWKAARLWVVPGLFSLRAFRKRLQKGELFPPFLFFALTNACNLRCRGCWVAANQKPDSLNLEDVEKAIEVAATKKVFFHTLLGGEPFLYPRLWELVAKHPECYFQIITNGQFLSVENVRTIRRLGNISPLVSVDGFADTNDPRRGEGTFRRAIEGCRELQKQRILYGVATVVTEENFEDVLTERYIQNFIDLGAMYLWFYVFRPVGRDPSPELCVSSDKMRELRRRLLELRRKSPIVLIDTYWNAKGEAVCPAAKGLGFHIGAQGSVEPCPPLSVCREFIQDNGGDLFKTINESEFLRAFQQFVDERTQGCVILERPQELARFFEVWNANEVGGRSLLEELKSSTPRSSHYLPGEEVPEDFWFYRLLKKTLFFGMGAYG